MTKADLKPAGFQLPRSLGPVGYLLPHLVLLGALSGTVPPTGAEELCPVGLIAAGFSLYPLQTSQLGGLILSQSWKESKKRPGSKS